MRIAICKGALFGPTVEILERIGLDVEALKTADRQLMVRSSDNSMEYIICRPTDVPVVVEYGSADIGIVGKDVLLEQSKNVYELLDLKFGKCTLIIAEPANSEEKPDDYPHFEQIRVASKFPNITEKYFSDNNIQAEVIKMHGNIELAPAIGLADQIVDLTATGKTLKENNLKIVKEIGVCTARLIANRASQKLLFSEINDMMAKIKDVVEAK